MHARAIVCCALAAMLSAACGERSAPSTAPAGRNVQQGTRAIFLEELRKLSSADGSAPFSLLTYDDVRSRARLISNALKDRAMPPWLPEAGHGDFAGERRVTAQDIERFERWVATVRRAGR